MVCVLAVPLPPPDWWWSEVRRIFPRFASSANRKVDQVQWQATIERLVAEKMAPLRAYNAIFRLASVPDNGDRVIVVRDKQYAFIGQTQTARHIQQDTFTNCDLS